MKIHEYQAKAILSKYGVAVPRGAMVESREAAERAAKDLMAAGASGVVVKAQIHAGGRGKGGGVKIAKSFEQAAELAEKILGMQLVTHQTGPEGKKVRRLLIEETLPIASELYLGIVLDRAVSRPVFMASRGRRHGDRRGRSQGPRRPSSRSTSIPRLACSPSRRAKSPSPSACKPELIGAATEVHARPLQGLRGDRRLAAGDQSLHHHHGRRVFALDAKVNFDDNALYRHPDEKELRDITEEDPLEVEASKYNLNYIKLDGTVGCMVNGAGLAMATMDIIKFAGGEPANFLDVGGGANAEQVTHAFEILLADKNVKAVLINIFGGILRVDTLANGVVEAARKTNIQLPIVLRLEGTNVEKGREILKASGLNFIVAQTMKDAAEKVVAAAAGR